MNEYVRQNHGKVTAICDSPEAVCLRLYPEVGHLPRPRPRPLSMKVIGDYLAQML